MAAAAVIAPIWRRFLSMYPEVSIELGVDEAATVHLDLFCSASHSIEPMA
jgi:hypothetical protein